MIIDSHVHIGKISFPVGKNRVSNLRKEDLLLALDKYQIDIALVSNIEGAEFDSDSRLGPKNEQIPQIVVMERTIEFVKENPRRLKALLWIKPFTEGYDNQIEILIRNNRNYIAGLKIHPYLSNLPLIDGKYQPYFELASKFQLPIQVHTENDGRSNVKYVHDVALIHNEIPFVMVHMGLDSDNSEAIDLIRKTDNLYGDTCEVETKKILKAIEVAGSEKILFGTDAVVHGIDTYERYLPMIKVLREKFSEEQVNNVLGKNCIRLSLFE
ncbi:MAG: amidohydrolase family protein [Candidatus Hodarchaeales archaeon]|jgi:predicted TIM-barrel fold metal-dependent hydrolase